MILHSPTLLGYQPERIVSLVPSQTELLFHLGLEAVVAGITRFCIHPAAWGKNKNIVGGTRNVNLDKIKALDPDLIIANKEENNKDQIEALALKYNLWVTDISNLDEALQMIIDIGLLTQTQKRAAEITVEIKQQFSHLHQSSRKIKTCYLIWRNPYMTIGGDTFIHDMLERCGLENIYAASKRYPEINLNELKVDHCQLLQLSSEPYPFKQQHIDEMQKLLPGTTIMLVDGELFSWYGSRLLQAPAYFNALFKNI
ncbi:MAG: ABC transporter substrate-binding protein [Chitinophagaceae bacterium]|nr:ABC transporter substrate-binding protein [Chitinophagaceae bacterium]